MKDYAFIFDMDGVIVDSNPYHKITLRQFAERYGHALSEQELIEKVYGRTNKEWIPNLFGRPMSREEIHEYGEEKEGLFRELFVKYIKPLSGLITFLKQAHALGIPMAIGTSAPISNLNFVLEHIPIRQYFAATLDESHVTRGKPHPEIYMRCAETLRRPPENCIVFEDSLSGVASADAAGCKCVGITTTHTAEELATKVSIPHFDDHTPAQLISKFFGTPARV